MPAIGEPSVEEILDSIKKVIARDNRAGAADLRRERSERGMARAKPQPELEPDDILELDSLTELETRDAEDLAADPARYAATIPADPPLIAASSASAMRDSLAALAMLAQPGAPPQIVRSGETSLEGLVRELLRPALGAWLETNLPPLVEQLVADEIARIVGKKS